MNFFSSFRIFLLIFLLVVGLILFLPVEKSAFGAIHQTFSSMQQSGVSLMSIGNIKWLAVVLGMSVLGFFAFSAYAGLRRRDKHKNQTIKKHIFITFGIYLFMYLIMLVVYQGYLGGNTDVFFMGFPSPTAWMLFGVGLAPGLLTYWYIKNFDEWVINAEDLQQIQAILAEEDTTDNFE